MSTGDFSIFFLSEHKVTLYVIDSSYKYKIMMNFSLIKPTFLLYVISKIETECLAIGCVCVHCER